jgi:predicted DCC family thiol-disulfide oxidoreductase YuxK
VGNPVLLYDGVCGLCNRFVQFVLRHDWKATFRFASLQSEFGGRVLARYGVNALDLDTMCVLMNCEDHRDDGLLVRSDAVLFVLRELGGIWRLAAWLARWLPRGVRDWGYRLIARNRYRIFGRYETCPVPSAEVRRRFLDS